MAKRNQKRPQTPFSLTMKLIDSNIIIYSTQPDNSFLREFIAEHSPFVSAISKVEVLGYYKLRPVEKKYLTEFLEEVAVIDISNVVIDKAVALRQLKKISVADSIIAATALIYDLELVTRNISDFKHIKGLKLHNPFAD